MAVFPPFQKPREGRNGRAGEGDVLALIFAEEMDMSEATDHEAVET